MSDHRFRRFESLSELELYRLEHALFAEVSSYGEGWGPNSPRMVARALLVEVLDERRYRGTPQEI